ncbi:MAG: hypothetical protein M1830_008268 [Pleopsidium flavum]|nr:MAG: hypothetical protein M1830_008268 [Pleopsidium flavum]
MLDLGSDTELRATGTSWIDDVGIMVTRQTVEQNCQVLQTLHTRPELWARRHASVLAPAKSELIHFTNRPTKHNISVKLTLSTHTGQYKNGDKLTIHIFNELKPRIEIYAFPAKLIQHFAPGTTADTVQFGMKKYLNLQDLSKAIVKLSDLSKQMSPKYCCTSSVTSTELLSEDRKPWTSQENLAAKPFSLADSDVLEKVKKWYTLQVFQAECTNTYRAGVAGLGALWSEIELENWQREYGIAERNSRETRTGSSSDRHPRSTSAKDLRPFAQVMGTMLRKQRPENIQIPNKSIPEEAMDTSQNSGIDKAQDKMVEAKPVVRVETGAAQVVNIVKVNNHDIVSVGKTADA